MAALAACWISGADAIAAGPSPPVDPTDARVKARFDLGPTGNDAPAPEEKIRTDMYGRPYLVRAGAGSFDVALGGYFDFVAAHHVDEGIGDGFGFEARRFNLFFTSQIAHAVRFTSELEFEHGAKEISLETAALDILFHHAVNLRAGILLAPLGKFNIAHDSPLYDIVDRPLVSTEIIPATLSQPGIGLFGTLYPLGRHRIRYEVQVVSGLGDGVIAADGTRIAAGKRADVFEKDNNGVPSVVGRLSYASPPGGMIQGELGVSAFVGIYNTFRRGGVRVDDPRWLRILAFDGEIAVARFVARCEAAVAHVDLPGDLSALHGHDQVGVYLESVYRILEGSLGPLSRASLEAAARFDYIDLNLDGRADGGSLGDRTARISLGPAFRPASATRLSLIYRHDWHEDIFGNVTRAGAVQLGLASYF
ncbi:Hypothetical protein A7982_01991 [Minicystis rosea]|nr:Hypothetical protein A7982_01991 [Minicystis rosea]